MPPLQVLLSCRDTDSSCLHVDLLLAPVYSFEPRPEIICVVVRKEESILEKKTTLLTRQQHFMDGMKTHALILHLPSSRLSSWDMALDGGLQPELFQGWVWAWSCPGSFPKGVISLLLLR